MLGMVTPPVCKIAHAFTHYSPSFPENQYLFLNFSLKLRKMPFGVAKPLVKREFSCEIFPYCSFCPWRKKRKKVLFCRNVLCQLKCILPCFSSLVEKLVECGENSCTCTLFPNFPQPVPLSISLYNALHNGEWLPFFADYVAFFFSAFFQVFCHKSTICNQYSRKQADAYRGEPHIFCEILTKAETVCFSSKRRY